MTKEMNAKILLVCEPEGFHIYSCDDIDEVQELIHKLPVDTDYLLLDTLHDYHYRDATDAYKVWDDLVNSWDTFVTGRFAL